jgi:hypothetical protein
MHICEPGLFLRLCPNLIYLLAPEQLDRSPRVRRVTFPAFPPYIHETIRMSLGFRYQRPVAHGAHASYTVRVPWFAGLPSASFPPLLAVPFLALDDRGSIDRRYTPLSGAVAVRLGVPDIKASRGLSPPSHFPLRFRSAVIKRHYVLALRAMPGARW